jgi:ferredoxin
VLVTDGLYCVACSACLQVCPVGACSFTEIDGNFFLLDELPGEPLEEPAATD